MREQTTHQRIALVTGANKGIGRAAAEQLAGLGMTVLIGARDHQRGEEAAAALRAEGGDVHAVTLDVTDPATVQDTATRIEERFGHLDVLVNNAGITGSGRVAPGDAHDHVPSTVELDPGGPMAALPPSAAYLPSKTALTSLTVQYANELRKDGVLVNAVAPGYVDTDSNNHHGTLTASQGAAVLVRMATSGPDGPTAGFFSGRPGALVSTRTRHGGHAREASLKPWRRTSVR
jgi:NAD(P)-dependent dehydrogenase (short-subunit alcohol dehydrogenase family)